MGGDPLCPWNVSSVLECIYTRRRKACRHTGARRPCAMAAKRPRDRVAASNEAFTRRPGGWAMVIIHVSFHHIYPGMAPLHHRPLTHLRQLRGQIEADVTIVECKFALMGRKRKVFGWHQRRATSLLQAQHTHTRCPTSFSHAPAAAPHCSCAAQPPCTAAQPWQSWPGT